MKLKSIKVELELCRKAHENVKVGDWAWLIHHEILVERFTEEPESRIKYILEHKPKSEQAERLRWMRPLVEDAEILADSGYRKATAELAKAKAEWAKASVELDKASADWDKSRAKWENAMAERCEATAELLSRASAPHYRRLFPDSPWNGKTLFPEE